MKRDSMKTFQKAIVASGGLLAVCLVLTACGGASSDASSAVKELAESMQTAAAITQPVLDSQAQAKPRWWVI
jgi:hypothetical protein